MRLDQRLVDAATALMSSEQGVAPRSIVRRNKRSTSRSRMSANETDVSSSPLLGPLPEPANLLVGVGGRLKGRGKGLQQHTEFHRHRAYEHLGLALDLAVKHD